MFCKRSPKRTVELVPGLWGFHRCPFLFPTTSQPQVLALLPASWSLQASSLPLPGDHCCPPAGAAIELWQVGARALVQGGSESGARAPGHLGAGAGQKGFCPGLAELLCLQQAAWGVLSPTLSQVPIVSGTEVATHRGCPSVLGWRCRHVGRGDRLLLFHFVRALQIV